jgi:molybdopterin synthase sulfur carrier subunit
MPTVRFTRHLRRFFPDLEDGTVDGDTVAAVIKGLDEQYPGFAHYIADERGRLRQHVNIFIGDSLIHDREALQDSVAPDDEVFILQALSGGALTQ